MDSKQQAQPAKKYLISCNRIQSPEFDATFKALLKKEAPFRTDIQNALKELTAMERKTRLTHSLNTNFTKQYPELEVSSNHSSRTSSTSVNPSKVCSKSLNNSKCHTPSRAPVIKRLVALWRKGTSKRTGSPAANCIPYNQGRLHTKELWQPPYFHISRSH